MSSDGALMVKPKLAITMGDPAGIGAEVLVKALPKLLDNDQATLFVIGNLECLVAAAAMICQSATQAPVSFFTISDLSELDLINTSMATDKVARVPVYEAVEFDYSALVLGQISAAAGELAVKSFEAAISFSLAQQIQGIVTCPINKAAVHAAGYTDDIGHQEILSRMTGSKLTATMLMTKGLKVAHLSTHKSLGQAVEYVRTPILVEKLVLTAQHLQTWCGRKPKIAVAALNPHGGEQGMLGREEIDEILPAVLQCQALGYDVVGPYPADSVFYRAVSGEFDAVMALYHDQGHIAIKMHNFEESITATMGIPFVRTSVDHGTAFDIAGMNKADANGVVQAVSAALDMLSGTLK